MLKSNHNLTVDHKQDKTFIPVTHEDDDGEKKTVRVPKINHSLVDKTVKKPSVILIKRNKDLNGMWRPDNE
jgi:hypothetical protein